jgi:dTDP-4-dehydrorhamnose reductase
VTTILLTGRTGQLGRELVCALAPLGRVVAVDRLQMDLARADAIRATIRATSPAIIVNAAAYTAVDKAESEPELAMKVNAAAPAIMAEEARVAGALLVHYSTDYVFDGAQPAAYVEDDVPHPLNAYGRSKLEGERAIAATGCAHLILRTSWVYSERGSNFVLSILRLARERSRLDVVSDQLGSPTWARALAEATGELLRRVRGKEGSGIYHLAAAGHTSRFELAKTVLEMMQRITGEQAGWAELRPITTAEHPLPAVRPLNVVISKERIKRAFGIDMPDWKIQLQSCLTVLAKSGAARDLLAGRMHST